MARSWACVLGPSCCSMSRSISVMIALAAAISCCPRGVVWMRWARWSSGSGTRAEVATLLEVVDQRFDRLLAHRGVGLRRRSPASHQDRAIAKPRGHAGERLGSRRRPVQRGCVHGSPATACAAECRASAEAARLTGQSTYVPYRVHLLITWWQRRDGNRRRDRLPNTDQEAIAMPVIRFEDAPRTENVQGRHRTPLRSEARLRRDPDGSHHQRPGPVHAVHP